MISYGNQLDLPNMKCTALSKLGPNHIVIDDINNTAGIYTSDKFDLLIRQTTTRESNQYYFYGGCVHGNRAFLSFSGGKFMACKKPSLDDIEVKILSEFNLSKPITSFLNYRDTFLICTAHEGFIIYFDLKSPTLRIPMKVKLADIDDIIDIKPLMRDPD